MFEQKFAFSLVVFFHMRHFDIFQLLSNRCNYLNVFLCKILLNRFLTFRGTFTLYTFCCLCDLKFSLYSNFKQLNSIGGYLGLHFVLSVKNL